MVNTNWLNTTLVRYPDIEHPCNKLNYCPYGQLVEEFPLHETATQYAINNNHYSKMVKGQGWVSCDKNDDGATPDLNWDVGKVDEPLACHIYGHNCPVHYHAEFADKN